MNCVYCDLPFWAAGRPGMDCDGDHESHVERADRPGSMLCGVGERGDGAKFAINVEVDGSEARCKDCRRLHWEAQ